MPLIRRAMNVSARPIRLFASPWSPPAWMKTNDNMIDSKAVCVRQASDSEVWVWIHPKCPQSL